MKRAGGTTLIQLACRMLSGALSLVVCLSSAAPADPTFATRAAASAVAYAPREIGGTYEGGELVRLEVRGRTAYVIRPTGTVDSERRWVWTSPFWLAIDRGNGEVEHRMYVERMLKAGFHVAGVDVGTSCGSPAAADLCHEFYKLLLEKYDLNPKARPLGQSNGGLIAYAWAFRHPECVDRVGCIYPATDFRSWPKLPQVITHPDPGLGFDLTLEELTKRQAELNPIDNLAPLAEAGVKILHIHGDMDEVVPKADNSDVFAVRYRELGGEVEIVTIKGLGHGGKVFYASEPLIEFLLGD